ncbi:selenophosphate synthase [Desulforhopalus singaporensis]|uniref:Selenophosphate synthase n=1 Tax=Desulforhopalus singaporensis TaxID=91360 RepID=A0A1H0SJ50_9BACT|nr:selenophosphate synthase [Desulforhopalus singaporensis]
MYRISENLALIQTVDFFTPIVDDPYRFGQIAAANALSDVYAMGGTPKTAMNLVAFPASTMDLSILRKIIEGGADKLQEAEVVLIGGHTIEDKEIKYGLSVTGVVHPDRVLAKKNLRPGDRLILTKPIGTGVINTAVKADMVSAHLAEEVSLLMAALNRDGARIMADFDVSACTDVTGFGLLGHLAEMVSGSGCSARINSARVPVIPGAEEFAAMGLIPAGAYNNWEFRKQMVIFDQAVPRMVKDLLFDPQTSGGLLISVCDSHCQDLAAALKGGGVASADVIGEIVDNRQEIISVV